jgi:hypothetical protein
MAGATPFCQAELNLPAMLLNSSSPLMKLNTAAKEIKHSDNNI